MSPLKTLEYVNQSSYKAISITMIVMNRYLLWLCICVLYQTISSIIKGKYDMSRL